MALTSAAGYRGQYQLLPSTFSGHRPLNSGLPWKSGQAEAIMLHTKREDHLGTEAKKPCCPRPARGACSASASQRERAACCSQRERAAWCSQRERAACCSQRERAACCLPSTRGGRALLSPNAQLWETVVLLFMCLSTCYTDRENQKRLNLNQNLCIQKCIKKVESSRKTPLPPRPTFTVNCGMRVGEGRGEGQFEFHVSCFCIN